MKIAFKKIRDGFDFVSFGERGDHQAYLDLESGRVYVHSDLTEDIEELPEDLDSARYIAIPHKRDLRLGRGLVLAFADRHLPEDAEQIAAFFDRKGAYARLKGFLEGKGMLDQWYAFETAAEDKALREWCADNDIDVDDGGVTGG